MRTPVRRAPAPETGYWVDLLQGERRLGAGFLLNRCFVLTALHCLRPMDAQQAKGGAGELVIALGDERRVRGRVCRRAAEADLALIEIDASHEVALPVPAAHVATPGDPWRGPYRPTPGDVRLSGSIDHGAVSYTCVAGASIEALQLTADQQLGDYSGYSGGPVEGGGADADPVVLGILLEQAMDRHSRDQRAANVLFAATIAEALRRFDHFDVGHLIDVLRPPGGTGAPGRAGGTGGADTEQPGLPASGPASAPSSGPASASASAVPVPAPVPVVPAPGPEPVAEAETLLVALRQWAENGLIDPTEAAAHRVDVVRRLIDGKLGESARERP